MIGVPSPEVRVTSHAVDRYLERIDGTLTRDEVEATILTSARAITIAASFGCRTVVRPEAKLVLDGPRVVTVLERFKRVILSDRPVA